MRNCVEKYIKGKLIQRVQDMQPGKLYIKENYQFGVRTLIKVNSTEADHLHFVIMDALRWHLNNFDYVLWDSMIMAHPQDPSLCASCLIWEAVEAEFCCKSCGNMDTPMPIPAYQIISGQRVGRSCNYYRCAKCGTLNRHIWITGYPTRYELQERFTYYVRMI